MVIACTFFFVILLFSPGCSDEHQDPFASFADAADSRTNTDHDETNVDASQNKKELALTSSNVIVAKLAPQTCHGNRLTIPMEFRDASASGLTIWHLCYKTPSALTSESPLARRRPTMVTVQLVFPHSATDLLQSEPPVVANPWTTSLLVALPVNWTPLFNFTNTYVDGSLLQALDGQAPSFPVQNGGIQAWRVHTGGTQTVTTLNTACRSVDRPSRQFAGLIPDDACHEGLGPCSPFTGLECTAF